MAKLEDLIERVPDAALRRELEGAAAQVKRRQRFGLVFEEHIPETTVLAGVPVRVGSLVQRRRDFEGRALFRVNAIADEKAEIEPTTEREEPRTGASERVPVSELLVVKRFGEPIYPLLRPLGRVENGPTDRPCHAVINGENFHALQLLVHLLERKVDCIYIDPPYNTGARDWKYNNRFVDKNDTWRHSKWLSMMQKRLKLAKRLLRNDGVLIVTVDANEVHHLGMLLERVFADARVQMVTICINPSGTSGEGLSRVDEYAYFCFLGGRDPVPTTDDMLTGGETPNSEYAIAWESLLRRGNAWYRARRKNLCYPVAVNEKTMRIVGVGAPFAGTDERRRPRSLNGHKLAWPIRTDGKLGIWRVDGARLMDLASKGYAYVSSWDEKRGTWSIKYLMAGTIKKIEAADYAVAGHGERGEVLLDAKVAQQKIAKTVWHRGRHTAGGSGGTQLLTALLGERDVFDFPKNVYAVRDCLKIAVGDRREALVLDFFAGSGTTLHATALLNAEDGGCRRCLMVTNNEVEEEQANALSKQGVFRGDPAFEARGVFRAVTKPRVEAALRGVRADGTPVPGRVHRRSRVRRGVRGER